MIEYNGNKLPSLTARLEAIKDEYKYLQNAINTLHTKAGILIALLSTLASAAFIRDVHGIINLFETNITLAIFRVIPLVALFVSFFISLTSYITVFFTHKYALFPYEKYAAGSEDKVLRTPNETVIIAMYKDYAYCIKYNQKAIKSIVKKYKKANRWLIATIVFIVFTLITTLI